MAKWIKTNGDVIEVAPKNGSTFELQELKNMVDGFIEIVYLNDKQIMVVNEEGKLNNLPFNPIATEVFRLAHQPANDFIVGNALLCNNNEID